MKNAVETCSCYWDGQPCDLEEDFSKVLTPHGVCYQFNAQGEPKSSTKAGSNSGLNLVLNVEQYEFMRGPQNVAGVRVCNQG